MRDTVACIWEAAGLAPPRAFESDADSDEMRDQRSHNTQQDADAQQIAVFAHAGVIRAVLALVFDSPEAALKCEIDPLSITHLRVLPDNQFSLVCINQGG